MPRKKNVNPDFGPWLRTVREAKKLTQAQASLRAGIKQQIWSRMERHGIVPAQKKLAALCAALEVPIDQAPINSLSRIEFLIRDLAMDRAEFKRLLIQNSKTERRTNSIELFLLREGQQPSDIETAKEFLDLLTKTEKLKFTVLFRDSNPGVWQSFKQLVRTLLGLLDKSPEAQAMLRLKLAGYYRTPDCEEARSKRMPMPHPIMLLIDGAMGRPKLYGCDNHGKALQHLESLGDPNPELKSSMIWPIMGDRFVNEHINWIGSISRSDLPCDRWQQIPWPYEE